MRLAEAQIAADCSDASDPNVRHVGTERGQRRHMFANDGIARDLLVCAPRADFQLVRVVQTDAVKAGDSLDVDKPLGMDDAHLHRQQQFGAAGIEHAVPLLPDRPDGVGDGGRLLKFEGCRQHDQAAPSRFLSRVSNSSKFWSTRRLMMPSPMVARRPWMSTFASTASLEPGPSGITLTSRMTASLVPVNLSRPVARVRT